MQKEQMKLKAHIGKAKAKHLAIILKQNSWVYPDVGGIDVNRPRRL